MDADEYIADKLTDEYYGGLEQMEDDNLESCWMCEDKDKQIETLKARLQIAVKALEWMNNKMDKKTSLNYWLSLDKDVIAATMVGVEVKAKQALSDMESGK
jgi:hypothetical protein